MANYLVQAQQKWTITPAPNAGGYPGSPYFKITIAGTDRTLAATENAELVVASGLHRSAGTIVAFRPACRRHLAHHAQVVPNSKETMALTAIGASFATLEKFDPSSNKQHWLVNLP